MKAIAKVQRQVSYTGELLTDALAQAIEAQQALYEQFNLLTALSAFPTPGKCVAMIQEKFEALLPKCAQGFDFPLVVPRFAIAPAQEMVIDLLKEHRDQLKDPWGGKLELNIKETLWGGWGDSPLQYRVGEDQWVSENRHYAEHSYDLYLLRTRDVSLPRAGQGRTVEDCPDITGGHTPIEYRGKLGKTPYDQELWIDPRGLLVYYGISIATQQIVPDVYRSDKGCGCWCPDQQFSSGFVPYAYFYASNRRLYLVRGDARLCDGSSAARRVVRVGQF